MQKRCRQGRPHHPTLGVTLRVGENRIMRGLYSFLQGSGQIRLAICRGLKLVGSFFGKVLNTQLAGYFAAKVPTHAIRDRHQQPALLNLDEPRLPILRSTAAIQGQNQMIVLIVAASAAHVGDEADTRA
jgi:hypothetical protein